VTLVVYKIVAALIILLVSLVPIIYPLRKKTLHGQPESIELAESFASGIFLGTAFFHMLPDAIHAFNEINTSLTIPLPEIICVMGFLLMLFLERLSLINMSSHNIRSLPYILIVMLVIHALVEGAALGVGQTFSESFMIFIAIIAHKMSESFALCIILIRHQLPLKQILLTIIFFSLMTPIGIAFGTEMNSIRFAGNAHLIQAIFNAFAAGTFLYMATLHHVRFHHHHQHEEAAQGMLEFAFLALGLVIMGTISIWV